MSVCVRVFLSFLFALLFYWSTFLGNAFTVCFMYFFFIEKQKVVCACVCCVFVVVIVVVDVEFVVVVVVVIGVQIEASRVESFACMLHTYRYVHKFL